jgi:tripartite-type tricarboxylate transporter receptor subunit TctC
MRLRQSDAPLRLFKTALNALVFAALATLGPAGAAEWPAKPVTIVHMFAAGGNGDFAARIIAKALTDKFGQSFTVDNRTGGGGTIGTVSVARAVPDGYTLLLTATGPAVLNELLFKAVPYDTERDFTPIILVGDTPQVIVGSPKFGFKTLQDLVAFGRKNPGKLNIGHPGAGSMGHLTAALFLARTDIQATLIGYRGGAPVVMDVLSGQIHAGTPAYNSSAKNATVLALTSDKRVSFLPEVPTAREAGVDLVASTWQALMGPAGLPPEIVAKLNTAINAFLSSAEGMQQFATAGIRPLGGTAEHLAETIKSDRALWAPIIAKENIKLNPD